MKFYFLFKYMYIQFIVQTPALQKPKQPRVAHLGPSACLQIHLYRKKTNEQNIFKNKIN